MADTAEGFHYMVNRARSTLKTAQENLSTADWNQKVAQDNFDQAIKGLEKAVENQALFNAYNKHEQHEHEYIGKPSMCVCGQLKLSGRNFKHKGRTDA